MRKSRRRQKSVRWPQVMVIAGLALLLLIIVLLKNPAKGDAQEEASGLPAQQLERSLADRNPTVVFFHSLTCTPCVRMMEVVGQVHPEFAASVVLVDVNVSDERNHPLMRREEIRAIPALVMYDRRGHAETYYGVMSADELRLYLQSLAGGN